MSDTAPVQTVTSNAFVFLADEESHGDRQATEALFLTFNTDLGFFEARLLGLLRATGARVTVVGDASVWDPDTRAIRHAGRSYHFGFCDSRAAFHPKLMVLTGEKRAIAAVGSGNLTMGGWQYNRELLTVFTGDSEVMPTAFGDIRNLLGTLADGGSLDTVATNAVRRTVTTLDGLLTTAHRVDTGHRVHASWDGPLIGHLPTGRVEELFLFAAFHDRASTAVGRILDRLQPRHVKVAVQPGWTHLDPTTLYAVLARYAQATGGTWEVLRDPASEGEPNARYRHGKLIEWVTADGARHALTGSPNLSHVGLIADVASGGNHEIAVIGPTAQPLFPGGTPITVEDIPTLIAQDHEAVDDQTTTPAIRVSSARTRDGEEIEVHLNKPPTTTTVVVEVSLHSDSPDHWTRLGDIEPGHHTKTFAAAVAAGSRIRAVTTDPATGLAEPTAPMYVTDVQRILVRAIPEKRTSRTHRAVAADLFGDDIALLDSLQHDLANFAKDINNAKGPTLTRETVPDRDSEIEHSRGVDTAEPWLWLQDDAVRRYGPGLASWLLALPQLHTGNGAAEVPWLDKIQEDTEVGLEDEDTEAATEEVVEADPKPNEAEVLDHQADRDGLKAARRKWAKKAVDIAPEVPTLSRLLILRLTLAFWSAGNWSDDDIEPFNLVRELIRSLDSIEERPDELRERVAAVSAVALTVMRQRTNLATHNEQALRYRQTAEVGTHFLHTLSEEAIDAYTTGLRTAHGGVLTAGHVSDTIAALKSNDPLAALQGVMEERGHTVTRPAINHIHICGDFSTPELVALEAIGMVEERDGVAVWASNPRGDWTLVGWKRPDLITINKRGATQPRWRHQRLNLMGPAAVAAALRQGGLSDLPGVLLPKHRPTRAARDVLTVVGIDPPDPQEPPQIDS